MKQRLTTAVTAGILAGALALSGCGAGADDSAEDSSPTNTAAGSHSAGDHSDHPADGGPAPKGIEKAESPKYPVGTDVTLAADHMEGMDGAKATVVGAFDTYTYAVDYTPTTGGDPVKNHKWVVQQEIEDAGDERLEDGADVTLEAKHMEGMKGAKATIASSTDETVYMVDYEADGMKMKNHKWVVESEIKPES